MRILVIVAAALLTLSACDRDGPAENAGEAIDRAGENASRAIENAAENVRDAAKGEK